MHIVSQLSRMVGMFKLFASRCFSTLSLELGCLMVNAAMLIYLPGKCCRKVPELEHKLDEQKGDASDEISQMFHVCYVWFTNICCKHQPNVSIYNYHTWCVWLQVPTSSHDFVAFLHRFGATIGANQAQLQRQVVNNPQATRMLYVCIHIYGQYPCVPGTGK